VHYSIGSNALSYDLVPDDSGAYHGVFQAGYITGLLLAPVIITNTALRFGLVGWIELAALFAVSGLLVIPVADWAVNSRNRQAGPASCRR
jgi:hypothetical protein